MLKKQEQKQILRSSLFHSHFFLVTLHPLLRKSKVDPLAQSVEHNTFNVGVLGSNPKRITTKIRESLCLSGFPNFFYPNCTTFAPPIHHDKASLKGRADLHLHVCLDGGNLITRLVAFDDLAVAPDEEFGEVPLDVTAAGL